LGGSNQDREEDRGGKKSHRTEHKEGSDKKNHAESAPDKERVIAANPDGTVAIYGGDDNQAHRSEPEVGGGRTGEYTNREARERNTCKGYESRVNKKEKRGNQIGARHSTDNWRRKD